MFYFDGLAMFSKIEISHSVKKRKTCVLGETKSVSNDLFRKMIKILGSKLAHVHLILYVRFLKKNH